MSYSRFAIYYLPPDGPLCDFGARWLGWDVARGRAARQFDLPGLEAVTKAPRKYGLHATLRPPFRLAEGAGLPALERACAALAEAQAPARCEGLELGALGRFLALTPRGDATGLGRMAAACLRAVDGLRAPPDEAELARRRRARLSPAQEALLLRWGYPYVMEAFRFHLTLTGPLPKDRHGDWTQALRVRLPELPEPFVLDAVALCGERPDGRFECLRRYLLTG